MMPLAQKNNMPCFQTWKKKENIHRTSNGFGVFARACVRNSIGRNAQMYFLRKSSKGVVPFSKGSHPSTPKKIPKDGRGMVGEFLKNHPITTNLGNKISLKNLKFRFRNGSYNLPKRSGKFGKPFIERSTDFEVTHDNYPP